ncbi:troponin C, isoallergen Bla g 6.0201 [Lepeophtheirus salmonis]|uniref:troponin C, isoallergen Bla g 6.0201 n=1 Tax=Lepeophtheirus salmonis TaxID=72036 RepID=UPI003AF351C9
MATEINLSKISEVTGLDLLQVESLQKAFEACGQNEETIDTELLVTSIKMLGVNVTKAGVMDAVEESGLDPEAKFNLEQFCFIASRFINEEDVEEMREELKEAFRIYDREGNGYITTGVLKEILKEIDPSLTAEQLEGIIQEVDEDGSGTVDFDEFQEMMMG